MSKALMRISGISGSSEISGYEGWIALDSFLFGVGRAIPMTVGRGSTRETNLPRVSEVVVTKGMDKSSNQLFAAACGSKRSLGTVYIHLCTNRGAKYQPYAKYELDNVMLNAN